MTILSAQSIRARCVEQGMVQPWTYQRQHKAFEFAGKEITLTSGVGPCGYDIILDEHLAIEPEGFFLGHSSERFVMPFDVMARVCDKSTWARRGVFVQNTVIEPGWRGHLTLEITYHGDRMEIIPAGTPIAQIIFEQLDAPTDMPYMGKYQDQERRAVEAR